jgi:hypothetical protein
MQSRSIRSRLWYAVAFGGKWAFIVASALYWFMFATILMVRGDGTGPILASVSASLIEFPVKLLGLPSGGAIVPAGVFWWLVVFSGAFAFSVVSSTRASDSEPEKAPWWTSAVVLCLIGAVALLVQSHRSEIESVNEEALVIEFVRTDPAVLASVDFVVAAHIVSISNRQSRTAFYEIGVLGSRRAYVFVERSRSSLAPPFKVSCVTHLEPGRRDARKHPCEQP